MKSVLRVYLAGGLVAIAASSALAQESKSAPLAKQLVAALQAAKLDSIAAKDPAGLNVYVGALYIPGFQLLVVSGSYTAPMLLDSRLGKKEYRDVYADLFSASVPGSRLLIEDLGADGLQVKRDDQTFDSVDSTGQHVMFDSDWKKQKISEEDYLKTFGATDERYAKMLTALLGQLNK